MKRKDQGGKNVYLRLNAKELEALEYIQGKMTALPYGVRVSGLLAGAVRAAILHYAQSMGAQIEAD